MSMSLAVKFCSRISISAVPSPFVSIRILVSVVFSVVAVIPVFPPAEMPDWNTPVNNPSRKMTSVSVVASKSVRVLLPAPPRMFTALVLPDAFTVSAKSDPRMSVIWFRVGLPLTLMPF
jgi:hypothetical protein